jgi:hypothetical protein
MMSSSEGRNRGRNRPPAVARELACSFRTTGAPRDAAGLFPQWHFVLVRSCPRSMARGVHSATLSLRFDGCLLESPSSTTVRSGARLIVTSGEGVSSSIRTRDHSSLRLPPGPEQTIHVIANPAPVPAGGARARRARRRVSDHRACRKYAGDGRRRRAASPAVDVPGGPPSCPRRTARSISLTTRSAPSSLSPSVRRSCTELRRPRRGPSPARGVPRSWNSAPKTNTLCPPAPEKLLLLVGDGR